MGDWKGMNKKMRVKNKVINLDYDETKSFFEQRAGKYSEENPYSTTMYQDNNEDLVNKRNIAEVNKILPLLKLNSKSTVLDVACGVGRWADAIQRPIRSYTGIDFGQGLIKIAQERNKRSNYDFFIGSAIELKELFTKNRWHKFNRIIIVGLLMYLNDPEVATVMQQISEICSKNTILYIREPIGTSERLTLKNFYSDELNSEYHAIYRTRSDYEEIFESSLFKAGFQIVDQGFLFQQDKDLNNRKETAQYFYILHSSANL